MAYQKQNFIDGEVLTAEKLNHIEDGLNWEVIKPQNGIPTDDIKDDAITEIKIAENAVSKTYSTTITTSWTGSTAPYTQDIIINGIRNTDKPTVGVVYSDTFSVAEEQRDAWSLVYRIRTDTNKITVYATDKTEVEIPIQLICMRK